MWASFISFSKNDRLRASDTFEKEVDPFAALTTVIGSEVEFLITSAVVVRKFLAVPELAMSNSVFDSVGQL